MNEHEKKELENLMMDVLVRQNQSDKKEVSPLLFELKGKLTRIDEKMSEHLEQQKITNLHLEKLNGQVAKHNTEIALLKDGNKMLKNIVFGGVGFILLATGGALMSLLLK